MLGQGAPPPAPPAAGAPPPACVGLRRRQKKVDRGEGQAGQGDDGRPAPERGDTLDRWARQGQGGAQGGRSGLQPAAWALCQTRRHEPLGGWQAARTGGAGSKGGAAAPPKKQRPWRMGQGIPPAVASAPGCPQSAPTATAHSHRWSASGPARAARPAPSTPQGWEPRAPPQLALAAWKQERTNTRRETHKSWRDCCCFQNVQKACGGGGGGRAVGPPGSSPSCPPPGLTRLQPPPHATDLLHV